MQHAAASLRKTEHGQQILSCREPTQLCERQIEFPTPGNWKNIENYGQFRQPSPGKSVLATSSCINTPSSIHYNNRNSNLLGNSSTATSKYEEKFLQKPKKEDFYVPSNDNFLNNSNFSTLSNLQQNKSYNISLPLTTSYNKIHDTIPINIKNTFTTTDPYNNTQTTTTTYSYTVNDSNNEQNLRDNIYPFQQSYNTLSNFPYSNEQSYSNIVDNNFIRDPKAFIHEFATKTLISDIKNSEEYRENPEILPILNKNKKEKSFVEELRDSCKFPSTNI